MSLPIIPIPDNLANPNYAFSNLDQIQNLLETEKPILEFAPLNPSKFLHILTSQLWNRDISTKTKESVARVSTSMGILCLSFFFLSRNDVWMTGQPHSSIFKEISCTTFLGIFQLIESKVLEWEPENTGLS